MEATIQAGAVTMEIRLVECILKGKAFPLHVLGCMVKLPAAEVRMVPTMPARGVHQHCRSDLKRQSLPGFLLHLIHNQTTYIKALPWSRIFLKEGRNHFSPGSKEQGAV